MKKTKGASGPLEFIPVFNASNNFQFQYEQYLILDDLSKMVSFKTRDQALRYVQDTLNKILPELKQLAPGNKFVLQADRDENKNGGLAIFDNGESSVGGYVYTREQYDQLQQDYNDED